MLIQHTQHYDAVGHMCWPSIKPTQFQWVVSASHFKLTIYMIDKYLFTSLLILITKIQQETH